MSIAPTPSVLQVVLSLGPGGTERLVLELVRRLRSEIRMAVCCLDDEGSWGEQLRSEHVSVAALRRTPGFRPALGRQIARFAADCNAQVLHCHHYSPFVYGCVARLWRPHLRVVFTEHGRLSDAPPSRKRQTANRLLSRAQGDIVAVSEDLKQHMVAEGFPENRVRVIHNGIDVASPATREGRACARRRLAVSEETFVIGTVARLDPVKDLPVLIQATAALSNRLPVLLLIIGDGSERRRLEGIAGDLDAHGHVRFLGHREDARDVLAACDAYANSSISEGVSLTILEAMAAGLPIVATRVGGTPEVVDDSCSVLVRPRDPAALAAALHGLAVDRANRERLGAAARARVEARFTIERMVGEYREAYLKAASSGVIAPSDADRTETTADASV